MKKRFYSIFVLMMIFLLGAAGLASAQSTEQASTFHGDVRILDNAPSAGDNVDVYLETYPGIPAITTQIIQNGEVLSYTVQVPGDPAADNGKVVIFVIGTRIAAKGIFASGTDVQIDFHPPQALPGGPYGGTVNSSISFSGSANDSGSDISTYAWDWNNDGAFDETGQNLTHSWGAIGSKTVNLKVTDAQNGEGNTSFTVTVTAAAAAMEITNLNQTYGSVTAPTVTTTPPGLSYSITYDSLPDLPVNAGSYAVEATITDPNYTGSASGTLVIDKAATVTQVTGGTFTYDSQVHAADVSVTGPGGLSLTPDPVYGGTCTAAPSDVTTPDCTASYTFTEQANYYGSSDTDTIVISPKAASATPAAKGKTYGDDDPALTGSLDGFIEADGITAVYSRTPGNSVAGSPYTISAVLSPAEKLGNYTITYNTAAFTINPKAASVTPAAKGKTYGDDDPALTGSLTGFLEADGISAVYSRTPGDTVAGSPYTISAVLSPAEKLGNYTITYNTAAFTIDPKAASVTPTAKGKTYGDVDPALTGSLTGFLEADGISAVYSRTPGDTVAGSPYTISAVLSPTEKLGNYTITYNTAAFTIDPKPASVTPNTASKVVGDADPVLSGSLNGFLAGDHVTAAYSRTSGETPGNYTISAVLSPSEVLTNYSITNNTAVFTIHAKHSISLVTGWNLISFNLIPLSTAIQDVLASVAGNYDQVYAWDASSAKWLIYEPAVTNVDTLTTLDNTRGFWIYMTAADTLNVIGTRPVTTSISLLPGWNLVGYPSDHTIDPAATGSPLVYAYQANNADSWKLYDVAVPGYVIDLTAIQPGYGYWIRVGTAATWNVTY